MHIQRYLCGSCITNFTPILQRFVKYKHFCERIVDGAIYLRANHDLSTGIIKSAVWSLTGISISRERIRQLTNDFSKNSSSVRNENESGIYVYDEQYVYVNGARRYRMTIRDAAEKKTVGDNIHSDMENETILNFWKGALSAFSLKLEHDRHLRDISVNDSLRDIFNDHKLALSGKAKIIREKDKQWNIEDGDEKYIIEEVSGQLNVYIPSKDKLIEVIVTDDRPQYSSLIDELSKWQMRKPGISEEDAQIKHQLCVKHGGDRFLKAVKDAITDTKKENLQYPLDYTDAGNLLHLAFNLDKPEKVNYIISRFSERYRDHLKEIIRDEGLSNKKKSEKIFDLAYQERDNYHPIVKDKLGALHDNWDKYTLFYTDPRIPKTTNDNEQYYALGDPRKIKHDFKTSNGLQNHLNAKSILRNIRQDYISEWGDQGETQTNGHSGTEIHNKFREIMAGGEGEWKRTHKQSLKCEEIRNAMWDHYNTGEPLIIHYRDGLGQETIRKIKINEIITNPGKNKALVKAHCYLRGEKRTFRPDRISEVERVD